MTLTAPPNAVAVAAPRASRDRVVDLVRAGCLLAVVGLHALMVGVSVQGGVPVLENALETWSGFTVFSWIAQMMPLFFILGGFASITHYRRVRSHGVRPADYIAARLRRLLPVPLAAATMTVLALAGLSLTGVPADIVATAGWRISQPLWFLGVYILCSSLVPLMVWAHERAPRATLAVLGGAIATVDALRMLTGIDAIGFGNLLFVWLGVQQLGFWLADGRTPGRRHALTAIAAMAGLMAIGASPVNLFDALNPPTAALALLGVVQLAVFAALRPRLALWADHPSLRAASDVINSRAMTIYSWHMPVVVLLAGLLIVGAESPANLNLPIPLSGEWWVTRPLWLGAAALAVALVVGMTGKLECRRRVTETRAAAASGRRTALGVVVSAAGVLVVLAGTGALWAWVVGALMLAVGQLLAGERARSALGWSTGAHKRTIVVDPVQRSA